METASRKNENLISRLNELVEINNDRIQGYERAINETEEDDLVTLFTNMAAHSRSFRSDLAREISALGGEPTEGTKNSGKIFRAWMDIKAALTGKNRNEILSSCEFGEDAAKEVYDAVAEDKDHLLTADLSRMVKMQLDELKSDHNKIKALRDAGKNL
ncbi:MAG: PA2169 family four-helix-bundle protein [Bacteroidia bacterium]|nr:PA2169 family four-helix-bundle protein [Bacteroidia bacterium]